MTIQYSITHLAISLAIARLYGNTPEGEKLSLAIMTIWPKNASEMRLTDLTIKLELIGGEYREFARQLNWYFKTMAVS